MITNADVVSIHHLFKTDIRVFYFFMFDARKVRTKKSSFNITNC